MDVVDGQRGLGHVELAHLLKNNPFIDFIDPKAHNQSLRLLFLTMSDLHA